MFIRLVVYLFRCCHPEALEGCLNGLRGLNGLVFLLVILEKLALQFYSESTSVQVSDFRDF